MGIEVKDKNKGKDASFNEIAKKLREFDETEKAKEIDRSGDG